MSPRQPRGRFRPHAKHEETDPRELGPPSPLYTPPRRPCLGCGRREVRGWTYCNPCRTRLRVGLPVGDATDLPTMRELRHMKDLGSDPW